MRRRRMALPAAHATLPPMARTLQSAQVIATLERLHARIAERFPDAGLTGVAADLVKAAHEHTARARRIGRPYYLVRLLVFAVLAASVLAQVWAAGLIAWDQLPIRADAVTLTQGLESAVNLLILMAAALWFLVTLEERLKRKAVLEDMHELRSFANVVDMHQLTKDPTLILGKGPRTSHSPVREMTRFQLTRYLDYCAEMLSLIGKLAALYGEHTRDREALVAIGDVENLATDLGRKIWQKITILSQLEDEA